MSILLKIGYIGTNYHGFQKQKTTDGTIETELEKALEKLCGEKISFIGASRTDAGVHALGQMIQLKSQSRIPLDKMPFALNNLLPWDIRVYNCYRVPENFHVRYSCLKKTYCYRIDNQKKPDLFQLPFAYSYTSQLDFDAMKRSIGCLLGNHNFKGFCSTGSSVRGFERTIYEANLEGASGGMITFRITGNGFLYNMIRIIVGTLMDIGRGYLSEDVFMKALVSGKREELGKTAPSKGLMLEEIIYPKGVLE